MILNAYFGGIGSCVPLKNFILDFDPNSKEMYRLVINGTQLYEAIGKPYNKFTLVGEFIIGNREYHFSGFVTYILRNIRNIENMCHFKILFENHQGVRTYIHLRGVTDFEYNLSKCYEIKREPLPESFRWKLRRNYCDADKRELANGAVPIDYFSYAQRYYNSDSSFSSRIVVSDVCKFFGIDWEGDYMRWTNFSSDTVLKMVSYTEKIDFSITDFNSYISLRAKEAIFGGNDTFYNVAAKTPKL